MYRILCTAIALSLLSVIPAGAQVSSYSTLELGDFGYLSGTVSGQRVSGYSQTIGSSTYGSYSLGGRTQISTSSQRIGSLSFGRTSTGLTATSQRIGSFDYTRFSNGVTSSTQRIGDFSYRTYSNGTRCTSQKIGSQTYTSCR